MYFLVEILFGYFITGIFGKILIDTHENFTDYIAYKVYLLNKKNKQNNENRNKN